MEVLLFVDTETTGLPTDTSLSPSGTDDWPRLVEIAWRTYSKSGQELNATSTLIRPDGFEIPEAATEVHGITTEKAREHGSDLKEVLTEFEERVREADCLVAHNVSFDRGILLAEYHRTGMNSSLPQVPVLCTMEQAKEVVQRSGEEEGGGPSLATLHEVLTGRSPSSQHRASVDVRTTVSCFWKLVGTGEIDLSGELDENADPGDEPPTDPSDTASQERDAEPETSSKPQNARLRRQPKSNVFKAGFVVGEIYAQLQKRLHNQINQEKDETEEEAEVKWTVLENFYARIQLVRVKGLPSEIPERPDPRLAVAYNYLLRGRPTRASLGLSRHVLQRTLDLEASFSEKGPTIDLDIEASFWDELDLGAVQRAFGEYREQDLAEIAGAVGSAAFSLLQVSRRLVYAAHIQIALLQALIRKEVGREEPVSLRLLGEDSGFAQAVVDDLNTLLEHIYSLHDSEQECPSFTHAEGERADLTISGPWSTDSGDEEMDPDSDEEHRLKLAPISKEELDENSTFSGYPHRAQLLSAPRIEYARLGEVLEEVEDQQQIQEFVLEDDKYRDGLLYFLRNGFRKRDFFPGQLPIINRALQGKDVVGLLPTGGGKSLTYQLCGLLQPGTTLIVDPINSLMRDQYDQLTDEWVTSCVYINSLNTGAERETFVQRLKQGELHFAFVSPERLQMKKYREMFEACMEDGHYFSYGVIDEAHCVSEWGHDFRQSYLHLSDNLQQFCTDEDRCEDPLPLFALTATASFDVLADVQRDLGMGEESLITLPPDAIDRDELHFRILEIKKEVQPDLEFWEREKRLGRPKYDRIEEFIRSVPAELEKLRTQQEEPVSRARAESLTDFFKPGEDGTYSHGGVIFCPTKSKAIGNGVLALRDGYDGAAGPEGLEERLPFLDISTFFSEQDDDTVKDEEVNTEASKSLQNQREFLRNESNLMIATKAFGMGIDKPDIRYSIHYSMPNSVESFYQEAGRAGRDGKPALCAVLYHPADVQMNRDFQANSFKGISREKAILDELLNEVHYEERFFVDYAAAQLRKQFDRYFRLNLFPTGDGEEPFLLYVNGPWQEEEENRICYGCLKIEDLSRFKPGQYESNVPDSLDAEEVLEATREIIRDHSEDAGYLEWLTRTRSPGIASRLEGSDQEEHRLKIGFTSDVVSEITERLKEGGNPQMEEVAVRASYKFCDGPEEFFDRLEVQYGKLTNFSKNLTLSKELREYLSGAFYRIRNSEDTQRAVYRLSVLGVVDDYVVDYPGDALEVYFHAKDHEDYRENLRQYLRRYLGRENAQDWLSRVDELNADSALKQYLWGLAEFVYEEIARKRERAIDYMDELLRLGLQEGEEAFRQNIVYYFTSKYARFEYLPEDLDQGKKEDLSDVRKYIGYIFDPPDGMGGNIDNAKHLRGACARLRTSLTGENATLDLLNAFSILVLSGVERRDASDEAPTEAIESYVQGVRRFQKRKPWKDCRDVLKFFHKKLREISPEVERKIRPRLHAVLLDRTATRVSEFNNKVGL